MFQCVDIFSGPASTLLTLTQDFTEVDNNVTRHVPEQLKQADWSVIVMHYLGMDHIGHKSGSSRYVYPFTVDLLLLLTVVV